VQKSELNIEIAKNQSDKNYQIKLNKAIKNILLEYISPLVDEFSSKLGYKYNKISVRKAKSKRGSCSFDQKLMFNINLLHLSTKYVRYVVVHEVCHLKHKNHSKEFRAEVE
jgi:predicted metal-dependent hydrolase